MSSSELSTSRVPALPAEFSENSACGERRQLIRKIVVGLPAIVAMTARSSLAGGGHDYTSQSDPSNC